MFLTDPPYNVNYEGKTAERLTLTNDEMTDEMYEDFLYNAFRAAKDAMRDGAPFYVWTAQGHAMTQNIRALDRNNMHFRQQLIWAKNVFVLGHMDYHGKHEPCLYGWKEGAGHFFFDSRTETTVIADDKEINPDKMNKPELVAFAKEVLRGKVATDVMKFDRPAASREHPTMKPVKLIGYLLRNSSQKGDVVLDLFGGSGTTMIAAEQLGRKCYMMELDPHYCDVIIARWEKLTGREAAKIN